jgi:hypothetical protein
MKKRAIVAVVLVVLGTLFVGFFYSVARGGHRARFIIAMNELREANAELQKYGIFTNQFRYEPVYPYTNRFDIDGRVYQCGLAVESVDLYLRKRGFLAITTNDVFVWVDKKSGAMPLGRVPAFTFPPWF